MFLISIDVKLESRSAYDSFHIATTSLELAKRAKESWEIEHHSITGITFMRGVTGAGSHRRGVKSCLLLFPGIILELARS